jgi:prolyl-tRNA editing enzyme YbaK/EbsC (Cys-tRNA(Pro) deacylase)
MTQNSRGPKDVQHALQQLGLDIEIKEMSSSTRSAGEAARAIGCSVAEIAKSIVFKDQKGGPILAIVSGANQASTNKISAYFGENVMKANADEVKGSTGYVIGGVPPLGHANDIRIVIDKDLENFQYVWAAAGSPVTVFRISTADLKRATNAQFIDLRA